MNVKHITSLTIHQSPDFCYVHMEKRIDDLGVIHGHILIFTRNPVADLGGIKGVQMHSPLAASNVFLCITARVHRMIMQQWHASTTTRHSYTLTYQFLTDLQTFD